RMIGLRITRRASGRMVVAGATRGVYSKSRLPRRQRMLPWLLAGRWRGGLGRRLRLLWPRSRWWRDRHAQLLAQLAQQVIELDLRDVPGPVFDVHHQLDRGAAGTVAGGDQLESSAEGAPPLLQLEEDVARLVVLLD